MPTPIKWGTEFLVNTTTSNLQLNSAITALADGRFVVTFRDSSSTGGDTSSSAVRAQIFNADGSKSGAEFLVNTTTISSQFEPTITALADGRFIIAFRDSSQTGGDNSTTAVRAQIFNVDGSKSGAEFLVNTTTSESQYSPSIAGLADGRFVVVFADQSQTGGDTSSTAVRAQLFNADGSKSGAEFLVNTTTADIQFQPNVSALADGRFVVAFADGSASGDDTSGASVRAQVFNADGSKSGAEFVVNTTTTDDQYDPNIASLADGRFVVTFQDDSGSGGDTSNSAVRAQVFNADGSKSGSEFLVNTTTNNSQFDPSVAGLADGRFVIAFWDDSASGGDTSSAAVRAQVFNVDGSKSGAEFLVNTATISAQYGPAITALADGRFVVSFTDNSQSGGDTSNSAIRGQIFDPRVNAVNLNGSSHDDDYVGSVFGDTLSGFYGDDVIYGKSGDDILKGEAGDDKLYGGLGNDRIDGGDGDDRLKGYKGDDGINGGAGEDDIFDQSGNDYVDAGADDDYVRVGGGVDNFDGGDGVDYISYYDSTGGVRLDLQSNVVSHGWANNDTIKDFEEAGGSKTGGDILKGTSGANRLKGYGGDDKLYGRSGDDKLYGGDDEDYFDGGHGDDLLYGGDDADTFHFDHGEDNDTIKDFENNVDTIELDNFGFANATQALTFATESGGNVIFDFGGGDTLTVENATKAQLLNDIDIV